MAFQNEAKLDVFTVSESLYHEAKDAFSTDEKGRFNAFPEDDAVSGIRRDIGCVVTISVWMEALVGQSWLQKPESLRLTSETSLQASRPKRKL